MPVRRLNLYLEPRRKVRLAVAHTLNKAPPSPLTQHKHDKRRAYVFVAAISLADQASYPYSYVQPSLHHE